MAIIAPQHQPGHWKHDGENAHVLACAWPEDCYVQWGARGVVVVRNGENYRTAFFEAFPKSAGFIRGEGKTIAEAERAAFAKFEREAACVEHVWQRRKYTNGGAFCAKCGAFAVVFRPIVELGGWRKPLSRSESFMLEDDDDEEREALTARWAKRRRPLLLRRKFFGSEAS